MSANMTANAALMRDNGPAIEANIAIDMVRRSIVFVPVLMIAGALFGGSKGVASTLFAIVVVLANFLLSAAMLSWAARISFAALGAAAMFGYIIRLGLITVSVLAVRKQPWVSIVIVGVMLIVTHLGLLLWELRYVSFSFSQPGVQPRRPGPAKSGTFKRLRGSTVLPADSVPVDSPSAVSVPVFVSVPVSVPVKE